MQVPETETQKDELPERSSFGLTRVWEDEKLFTKLDPDERQKRHRRFNTIDLDSSSSQKRKKGHHHRLDPLQFCTISTYHNSMIQPRSKGFIDFGLQTKRPNFPTHRAHEHRFQYLNHMPTPLSANKHVPQWDFSK